jgi:hypothetical protein
LLWSRCLATSKAAGSKRRPESSVPFLQLDYLYTPSKDVAADVRFFTEALGGKLAFSIEAMDTRVAMIELTSGPPHVVLADHLEGDRPILVYRVDDLLAAKARLKGKGWKNPQDLELPMGPAVSFASPRGHRIAIYEPTRPQVAEGFKGRRDF